MNILKSLIVFAILSGGVFLCIVCVRQCIRVFKNKSIHIALLFGTTLLLLITTFCIVCWGDYVYPFERKLEPVLIAELDVPPEYELDSPGQKFWHGAYEHFGLYAESFYFNPDSKMSIYGYPWPPLNFRRNSYIFTYGQKIDYLSYNVWDIVDGPIRSGAKVGHMILDDEFHPEKVYIYRIPKIRIENDINDLNRPWD